MTPEIFLAGSLLLDGTTLQTVQSLVTAADFENPLCQAVYTAACDLYADGVTIDPVTIRERSRQSGTEIPIDWVREALEVTPTAASAVEYATLVVEGSRLRKVKSLAYQIIDNQVSTSAELLAELQRGMESIQSNSFSQGLCTPADRIHGLFDHILKSGANQFVSSGYPSLDKILGGGFIRGGLYIIGARPAVGKTTFALNLADGIAGNVLFISLEMSPEAITAKQFSKLTGVPTANILTGAGGDELWQKLGVASVAVEKSGVHINRRYDINPGQLQLLAQSVPDLRAIVVDYLGLILPNTPTASTYERISAISRELKRIALQLKVPVICLSQLSRGVESREDKRPRLADLRDSGAIEQDADAVMFLYREDYYHPNISDGGPSVVELSVAKNRHGGLGKVEFLAYLHTSYFRERGVA